MALMMFGCADFFDSLVSGGNGTNNVSDPDTLSVYSEEMRYHIDNCDENYAQFGADIIFMQYIATNDNEDHETSINCKICYDIGEDYHRNSKKITDSYYVLMSDCNIDTLHAESTIYTESCPNEDNHPDPEIPEESIINYEIVNCKNGEYSYKGDEEIYRFKKDSFNAVRQSDCENEGLCQFLVNIEIFDILMHHSITDTCDQYELINEIPLGIIKSCDDNINDEIE